MEGGAAVSDDVLRHMTFEKVRYTWYERVRIWLYRIGCAVICAPPTHWSKEIILYPGDEGYNKAPCVMLTTQHRWFDYEKYDGELEVSGETETTE